jgi:hypothetical protein
MRSNNAGGRAFFKVAAHGVAHGGAEFGQTIGLGEDLLAQRPCDVAAFGGFFDQEDDFIHGPVRLRWTPIRL